MWSSVKELPFEQRRKSNVKSKADLMAARTVKRTPTCWRAKDGRVNVYFKNKTEFMNFSEHTRYVLMRARLTPKFRTKSIYNIRREKGFLQWEADIG